ncbi:MAG: FtsX-like permease family protein [Acidimicrobiales bacterium]
MFVAAVWYRCRAQVRGQWRGLVVIAVMVGMATATVLTALAGARRTSSLFDRYFTATRTHDVWLDFEGRTAVDPTLLDRIEALPQVDTFARLASVAMFPRDFYVPLLATVDGRFGVEVDRWPIVGGRQADPRIAEEVMLSEDISRRLNAPAGSHVAFGSYAPDQADALAASSGDVPFGGPDVTLTVAGVVRTGNDLVSRPGDITVSVLTPAFYEKYRDRILTTNLNAAVRLRGGPTAVTAFSAAVRQLTDNEATVSIEPVDTGAAEGLHDGFRVLAAGLFVFAAVAAAAALVAFATVLGRRALNATTDDPVLAAIGMSVRQRSLAAGGPVVPAVLAGAILGAVGAFGASTFMPVGIARRAELSRGFDADWTVLLLGALAVTVAVATIGLVAAWGQARRATAPVAAPQAHLARAVGRQLAALGPVASVGTRLALEPGRGRTAVPVRPALLGCLVGIGAMLGALGLSASLDRLVATPSRYGWAWDLAVVDADINQLEHNPDLAAVAEGRFHVPLVVDGRPTSAMGLANRLGEISPTVVEGRPPRSASEIVLGTDTLDRLHRKVGDTVTTDGPAGSRQMQVVGRGVFDAPEDPLPLADGAALTLAGLDSLGLADGTLEDQSYAQYLVRWAPGVDTNAAQARLAGRYELITPRPPPEVQKLTEVQALPRVLAGFLASIAALAMGYALVTAVSRRQRDFAVLRTIGFTGRQVSGAIAWQASMITAFGVAAGIPLGLVVGRVIWAHVAGGLGVATDTALPTLALLVAVPSALFAANLVAFVPGRVAARTRPANTLRSE